MLTNKFSEPLVNFNTLLLLQKDDEERSAIFEVDFQPDIRELSEGCQSGMCTHATSRNKNVLSPNVAI